MRDDHQLKFCAGSFLPLCTWFLPLMFTRTPHVPPPLPAASYIGQGAAVLLGLETDVLPIVKGYMIPEETVDKVCLPVELFDYWFDKCSEGWQIDIVNYIFTAIMTSFCLPGCSSNQRPWQLRVTLWHGYDEGKCETNVLVSERVGIRKSRAFFPLSTMKAETVLCQTVM